MKTVYLFFTLCLTVMANERANVVFWFDQVKMTCPYQSPSWEGPGDTTLETKTMAISDAKKINTCVNSDNTEEKYKFYVKGYGCSTCYELDGYLVVGIITGDILITCGIVILIYHWAQKKSGSSPASAIARPGPRGGPRGPAVPNRDYEVLNPRTRDATYAVAGVNRTG